MSKPKGDEGRETFLREAAKLYDEMIKRAGPASGDTFDDIEEQAEGIGRKLILKMLRDRLAAEAQSEPETATCATCGKVMRRPKGAWARHLDTASGTVRYERRHAICDRCGASFSPSGPPPEHPATRGIGPAPAKGLRGQRRRLV
jgi:hypothetical protein